MFKNLKLRHQLTLAFLFVGVVPLAISGALALINASNALTHQAFAALEGVRSIKDLEVERHFEERQEALATLADAMALLRGEAISKFQAVNAARQSEIETFLEEYLRDVQLIAASTETQVLFDRLQDYHVATNVSAQGAYDVASAAYQAVFEQYGAPVLKMAKILGFDELVLACSAHGHVMFSVARRADLGTNLVYGPYKDGILASLWEAVLEARGPALVDFAPYGANGDKPTAFAGVPMYRDGGIIGVMAVQISLERINEIMTASRGLGKTGEAYLVGPDRLMRSDAIRDLTHRSVVASFSDPNNGRVETAAVEEALTGARGTGVTTNYAGDLVLSSWAPFRFGETTWALVADVGLEEVMSPAGQDGRSFLERFTEINGFYDAFLIDPGGDIFFSVAKEAEYGTNLLNGPYRDSSLARLFAEVLKSGTSGMVDFEPYGPSGGVPAAFIAAPVLANGEVDMVVALQLSIDEIDALMQESAGLGESGESYLVGPDKRMRSDSRLEPESHSIAASFAGTVEANGVDTEAVRAALAGGSGSDLITDYRGTRVLSSYAPVKVGETTWAVLAEIDQAEAFAAVRELQIEMLVLAVLVIAAVLAFALWLSRSLTRPISEAVDLSMRVSDGHLDNTVAVRRGDEIGDLLRAVSTMSQRLRGIVREVRSATDNVVSAAGEITKGNIDLSQRTEEQASSLEETASSMEELTSTVKQNADNAEQANSLAGEARAHAEQGVEVASRAVAAMDGINSSSKRIADIIGVIDEIAFQTNLLSLNAAVEAARAGEHGRGFAVVADEVRKLAQRSADAAKEIKGLINDSTAKVDEGGQMVSETGAALSLIVATVQQVSNMVAEISAASREQSIGIEQVNKAVVQMDEVTQQNASLVEEAASAAGALEEQARQLQATIAYFKVEGDAEDQAPARGVIHLPSPQDLAPRHDQDRERHARLRHAEAPARSRPRRQEAPDADEWEEF